MVLLESSLFEVGPSQKEDWSSSFLRSDLGLRDALQIMAAFLVSGREGTIVGSLRI